jgi:hypothetical protein
MMTFKIFKLKKKPAKHFFGTLNFKSVLRTQNVELNKYNSVLLNIFFIYSSHSTFRINSRRYDNQMLKLILPI